MLEIKSFVSLKNESLLFWTRVHFKGAESISPKFWGEGVAHMGGGGGGGGVEGLVGGGGGGGGGGCNSLRFFRGGGWS